MKIKIQEHVGFLEVVTSGQADPANWDEVHSTVFTHPSYVPGCKLLVDHQQLEMAHLSSEDVQAIASLSRARKDSFGKSLMAILVSRDVDFGLVRMWEAYASTDLERKVMVFRDREKAVA